MRRVLLVLLAALATIPSAARAQEAPGDSAPVSTEDDAQAKSLFEQGKTLYEEGHYTEAIEAWQEAYRLSGRPLLRYNVGNAYERLGDLPHAIEELRAYRAVAPVEEQATLDQRIASLAARQAQSPAPPAPEPSTAPALSTPGPSAARIGVATWSLGGVAVAGAGVGLGFGVAANRQKVIARGDCIQTDGTYCWVEAEPHLKANQRDAAVADVGFGVAGAAAIAGVVVTLVDRHGPRVHPLALRGGGGLLFGGTW